MRPMLLLFFLLLGCEADIPPLVDLDGPGEGTWVWENPQPVGLDLLAVGSHSGIRYAVGRSGTFLRDGGRGWAQIDAPFADTLVDLAVLGPDRVVMVGAAGRIAEWQAGSWILHESGTTQALGGIAVDGSGRWLAVGDAGTRLVRDGDSWTPLANDDLTADLEDLHITPSGAVFAVSTRGGILRGTAAGWVEEFPGAPGNLLLAVIGFGGDEPFAAGRVGGIAAILQRDQDGWGVVQTWPTSSPFVALTGEASDRLWAARQDGVVSFFDGSTWTDFAIADSQGHAIWDADLDDAGFLRVVGTHGGVYERDTGGAWSRVTEAVAPTSLLWSATLDASGDLWAVGEGIVLRAPIDGPLRTEVAPAGTWFSVATTGDGLVAVGADGHAMLWSQGTWTGVDSPVGDDLRAVWAFGPQEWIAVGRKGTILHHDASGWQLEREADIQAPDWNAIWARDAGFVVVVGERGALTIRSNGTWFDQDPLTIADLHDVWGSSASEIVVVGNLGAILRFDGQEWNHEALFVTTEDDFLTAVGGRDGDDLFAAGNRTIAGLATQGLLYRYDGIRWTRHETLEGVGYSDLVIDADDLWAVGAGGMLRRHSR